jgi:hypothetical protein
MITTHAFNRREFLTGLAGATTSLGLMPWLATAAPAPRRAKTRNRLVEPAFRPLPLGAIEPQGWLQRQLRLQADGLSGHLDEFWPDIAQSQWFGGKAEGWERAPYWLDGAIPLAWGLRDAGLQQRITGYVKHIVAAQRADGWYAPYPQDASAKPYDLWAMLLANKALAQYHEATGEPPVLAAIMRNLKAVLAALERKPLFDWGKFRWFEGLIPAYYAYERTGEPWLLDLAGKLQAQGFDYQAFYGSEDATNPTPRRGRWTYEKHVVNTGMALKAYGLSSRLTGSARERNFPAQMLDLLDRYHGQVTGMFTGDECLAGKSPTQGTELCAVVETLFSLELLLSVTGTARFGDRLEKIAFNALPAAFSPDMWAHQYDQQVNQAQCTINPDQMWSTNGQESNLFGLEPNYGCCTANLSQGWPKFAAHLWMRAPDEGIAAVAYAPSRARFQVRGIPVRAEMETDYPFREAVRLLICPEQPARFPVVVRVPAWAEGASLQLAGGAAKPLKPGSWHTLDRRWKGETEIRLHLPMKPRITRRYNSAVAIERGPLVYSLKLGETRTRVNADKPHRELPHGDFEVRPTTPWNYALAVSETKPDASVSFEERPVGERPFSPEGAGVIGKVKGRKLGGWRLAHGWADEVPPGPQHSREPIEELTLLPYGCTNIRVTEFPCLPEQGG